MTSEDFYTNLIPIPTVKVERGRPTHALQGIGAAETEPENPELCWKIDGHDFGSDQHSGSNRSIQDQCP